MRALSIPQPDAEWILRGRTDRVYRRTPTRFIGERFYIYASAFRAHGPLFWWDFKEGRRKSMPGDFLRRVDEEKLGCSLDDLDIGLLIGTAVISRCQGETKQPDGRFGSYKWFMHDVRRLRMPLKPRRRPQPTWFWPFDIPSLEDAKPSPPRRGKNSREPMSVRVLFADSTSKSAQAYGGAVVWIEGLDGDLRKSGEREVFEHPRTGSRWRRTKRARIEPSIPNAQMIGLRRVAGKAELKRGMQLKAKSAAGIDD
jgi:hypothetical protein